MASFRHHLSTRSTDGLFPPWSVPSRTQLIRLDEVVVIVIFFLFVSVHTRLLARSEGGKEDVSEAVHEVIRAVRAGRDIIAHDRVLGSDDRARRGRRGHGRTEAW